MVRKKKLFVVEPYDIPYFVKKGWNKYNLFESFTDVVEKRLDDLHSKENRSHSELISFYHYALKNLNLDLHQAIQVKYLNPAKAVRAIGIRDIDAPIQQAALKYIDPVIWIESKYRLCKDISLDTLKNGKILDIGTGPGHFGFAASFWGHNVIGLEHPLEISQGNDVPMLYDDLCSFYGVERVPFEITSRADLPSFKTRFEVVTAFLAAFNTNRTKDGDLPWCPLEWSTFLGKVSTNWLAPNGRFVMTLAREKVSSESLKFLKENATKYNTKTMYFEF